MYLRTLIGPNAGQVFDFSPEATEAMLADGRAVKAYPDTMGPLDSPEDAPEAGKPAASRAISAAADAPERPATVQQRRDRGRRRR